MAEITKTLWRLIADAEADRISPKQFLDLLQDAIDNGDILLPENELHVVAVVIPLVDEGILKPSSHSALFEERMNSKAPELVKELKRQELN